MNEQMSRGTFTTALMRQAKKDIAFFEKRLKKKPSIFPNTNARRWNAVKRLCRSVDATLKYRCDNNLYVTYRDIVSLVSGGIGRKDHYTKRLQETLRKVDSGEISLVISKFGTVLEENIHLQQSNASLRKVLKEKDKITRQLKAQNEGIEKRKQELMASFKKSHEESRRNVGELEIQNKKLEDQNEKLDAQNRRLTAQNEQLASTNRRLEAISLQLELICQASISTVSFLNDLLPESTRMSLPSEATEGIDKLISLPLPTTLNSENPPSSDAISPRQKAASAEALSEDEKIAEVSTKTQRQLKTKSHGKRKSSSRVSPALAQHGKFQAKKPSKAASRKHSKRVSDRSSKYQRPKPTYYSQ